MLLVSEWVTSQIQRKSGMLLVIGSRKTIIFSAHVINLIHLRQITSNSSSGKETRYS